MKLLATPGESVVDRLSGRIGFRRARLVMHEDAWAQPDAFPKGRSDPPITLEVNGRRIFCKGANWVSPDIFPGRLGPALYDEQLAHVRATNMNLLRMWGGAPAQKEAFYERCDEMGIMVWQEFPLACNEYPDDPVYLATLELEARSVVTRLRQHPSGVLWCGGNELFNGWSRMTDQSLPLRLLDKVCYELDPLTPFLMTSPVGGMGHGHYVFRDPMSGQEAWSMFQGASCTAYTEFGIPSPAGVDVLREIIPAEELYPPRRGTSWESHHAFGVWMESSHLYLDVIEGYFGPCASLEQLVERGQLLQAEGYRGLYEEARRQKPKSAMALCWCLNEPWPTAANNSLLSWPARPKPALAAVGEACRPVLASARVRKFQWRAGEAFDPELFLLNDSPDAQPAGLVEAVFALGDVVTRLATWDHPALEPNRNARGPRLAFVLPAGYDGLFELRLRCPARPELNSTYRLLIGDVSAVLRGASGATRTMNL